VIHTDGTPTIANAPARDAFTVVDSFVYDEADDAILEREAAGIRVTLHYFANHPVLRVTDAEGEHSVIVAKDRALDAFEHPYLYIAR
jgi:YD repeat-containing protein